MVQSHREEKHQGHPRAGTRYKSTAGSWTVILWSHSTSFIHPPVESTGTGENRLSSLTRDEPIGGGDLWRRPNLSTVNWPASPLWEDTSRIRPFKNKKNNKCNWYLVRNIKTVKSLDRLKSHFLFALQTPIRFTYQPVVIVTDHLISTATRFFGPLNSGWK